MTKLPVNYMANQVSNADVIKANPELFTFFPAPMYVNCPDIGPVGEVNPDKVDAFQVGVQSNNDNVIQGSHASLIMQAGKLVEFQCPTCDGLSTSTNMMGAFTFLLESSKVPEDDAMITVVSGSADVFDLEVEEAGETSKPMSGETPEPMSSDSFDMDSAASSQTHTPLFAMVVSVAGFLFSMS